MIYDCFPFFNELDILEIRLNTLYETVDYFVITEANKTHTGSEKEYIFEQNKERFTKFLNKIIYIKIDDFPDLESSKTSSDGNKWLYENYQRDAIMRGLENCKPDDIVIISDCDEIPNPEAIKKYKDGICSLMQLRFGFNYNSLYITIPFCKSAKICKYKELINPKKKIKEKDKKYCLYSKYGLPTYLRFVKGRIIKNGGWHFSYIGNVKSIKYKMNSIVEQQVNTINNNTDSALLRKIQNNEDILERGDIFANLVISDIFPDYFVSNAEKYTEYINFNNRISFGKAMLLHSVYKIKRLFKCL